MLTFLNIAKLLTWVAMLFMLFTESTYFMGAVIFYYIALAVLSLMGTALAFGCSGVLTSHHCTIKSRAHAAALLCEAKDTDLNLEFIMTGISVGLLGALGLTTLAMSQMIVLILSILCVIVANNVLGKIKTNI